MTTLTRWAIAGAVCVLWAWSAVNGEPTEHDAAVATELAVQDLHANAKEP